MKLTSLSVVASFAVAAYAHTTVYGLWINGVFQYVNYQCSIVLKLSDHLQLEAMAATSTSDRHPITMYALEIEIRTQDEESR